MGPGSVYLLSVLNAVTSVFMKWPQEDQKFRVILGYIVVCDLKASLVYVWLHLRKQNNTKAMEWEQMR